MSDSFLIKTVYVIKCQFSIISSTTMTLADEKELPL